MKSCREIHLEASLLLDGELPYPMALGLHLHVLLCRHCRRFLRHLRLVSHGLARRTATLKTPEPLVDRLIEQLEYRAGLGGREAEACPQPDFRTPGPRP